MPSRKQSTDGSEWKADLRRVRAFWFGSRGFRPKLMRGAPMLGWPESPTKPSPKRALKKSDRMAARY